MFSFPYLICHYHDLSVSQRFKVVLVLVESVKTQTDDLDHLVDLFVSEDLNPELEILTQHIILLVFCGVMHEGFTSFRIFVVYINIRFQILGVNFVTLFLDPYCYF